MDHVRRKQIPWLLPRRCIAVLIAAPEFDNKGAVLSSDDLRILAGIQWASGNAAELGQSKLLLVPEGEPVDSVCIYIYVYICIYIYICTYIYMFFGIPLSTKLQAACQVMQA